MWINSVAKIAKSHPQKSTAHGIQYHPVNSLSLFLQQKCESTDVSEPNIFSVDVFFLKLAITNRDRFSFGYSLPAKRGRRNTLASIDHKLTNNS